MQSEAKADEAARLRALKEYRILDTPPSASFDRLTTLALRLFSVPTALITLIDEQRQWFKSRAGMSLSETPREIAFCDHTIRRGAPLIVGDASQDMRFATNPLVNGDPWIRAYAGVPIRTREGYAVGTIAIIDYVPRFFSEDDVGVLSRLAEVAEDELELWRHSQLAQRRESERLRAADRWYGALIENTLDVIALVDRVGTVLYASPAIERVMGYKPSNLVGRTIFEGSHPEDRPQNRQTFQRILERPGETQEIRYRWRHRDGTWRVMSALARNMLDDPDVGAIIVSSRDVTEHERAITALADSERYYRALTEGSSELVVLTDPFGEMRFAAGALATFGYDAEQLAGSRFQDFVDPEECSRMEREFRRLGAEPGSVMEAEYRFRTAGGVYREVDCSMKNLLHDPVIRALVITMRDVSQRKLAERQARQRILQQATVAELGQVARIVNGDMPRLLEACASRVAAALDVPGVALFELTNDGAAVVLRAGAGLSDAVLGQTFTLTMSEDDRSVLLGHEPVIVNDLAGQRRFRLPNRPEFHRFTSAIAVAIEGVNRPFGVLAALSMVGRTFSVEDGTFLRAVANVLANEIREDAAKTELKKRDEQLRRAQKMEAIGQLAGGIAHDFNNALTAIVSYAELAMDRLPPGHPIRLDISEIRAAGERAASLTRQILAFSRQQVLQPVELDLSDLVLALMNLLSRTLGEQIRLELIRSPVPCRVRVDPHQLEQVIINLCVNARDAMPNGGRITIQTRCGAWGDDQPSEWAGKTGRYAELVVADTGSGMPPEVLEHVFEPFFTTKEVGRGTGLGLATVYGIVQQHDGTVLAESRFGSGSVFRVILPYAEPRSIEPVPRVTTKPPQGSETILLAEDDDLVRSVAVRILRSAGYAVLVAKDGAEAVRLFEQHQHEIGLVLLDVVMPNLGGREALERIRARKPDVKFLLASGYARIAETVSLSEDEQSHWLSKPYDSTTLLQRIRAELDAELRAAEA